jgi:hypothetical protein
MNKKLTAIITVLFIAGSLNSIAQSNPTPALPLPPTPASPPAPNPIPTTGTTPPPNPNTGANPTPPPTTTSTPTTASNIQISSPFQIGFGIGWNHRGARVYDYSISPVGYKLSRDEVNKSSCVLSTMICYSPKMWYVRTNDTTPFRAPGWFTIMAGLNLADIGSESGAVFNKKIGGGIGVGLNIQNFVHLGVLLDYMPYRILRSNFERYLDQQIVIGTPNTLLTSLDETDNNYFITKFFPSISIKAVFIINTRKSDEPSGIVAEKR